MRGKEVLGGKLLNEHLLDHGDFAGVWNLILGVEDLTRLIHGSVPASVHVRLFRASLAQAFSFLNTVRISDEVARCFIHLAFFTADGAFPGLGLFWVLCSLVGRIMSLPLICGSAVNMPLELLHEVLIGQVLLLLLFYPFAFFGGLNLDLIDDVECAAVVTLQVRSPQLENCAKLFARLIEAISDMRHYIPFANLFEVGIDYHAESGTMLAHAHLLLNSLNVVLRSVVLLLLQHLYVSTAVALPHMLNEIRAITDLLALKSVDEWAVPLVEAI